jgi:hypothetical protein
MDGIRMDERNFVASEARARLLVDHLGTFRFERPQGRSDVGHLESDVVHARSTLGEKPSYGCVLAERRDKLYASVADSEVGGLHPLVLHPSAQLDPRAEEALVRADGGIEVLDRERDMVDGADLHAPILSARVRA